MKKIVVAFLLLTHAYGMRAPENPTEAADWYQRMEAGVEKWKAFPNKEQGIRELADYVFKFGDKMPNHSDQRWHNVYFQAQSALLSIPGHAEYFRDEIERERAKLGPDDYRGNYDRSRHWWFETLSHLPSPETVWVLGEFLSDERDAAKEAKWTSDGVLYGLDPNCKCALDALGSIGLRDPGFVEPDAGKWPSHKDYATREERKRAEYAYLVTLRERRLKPWREWYAELRDGKRAFSFKGQNVEYRFKPDGTWDTIPISNPPDDGPEAREAEPPERRGTRPLPEDPPQQVEPKSKVWPWLGGAVAALIALLAWFFLRRRNA